jgi:5-formyltetrahydrofolate cyclo-ligase
MTPRGSGLDIQQAKAHLRQAVLTRIAGMPTGKQSDDSVAVCAQLRRQEQWKRRIPSFSSPPQRESQTSGPCFQKPYPRKESGTSCFDRIQKAYLARVISDVEKDVCHGYFGIREPNHACPFVTWKWLDLILVPGVAFDLSGRRVGRGKGYYDRLLTSLRGLSCGVAFDEQIVDAIPTTRHDRTVDCILTPTRWVPPPQRPVPE